MKQIILSITLLFSIGVCFGQKTESIVFNNGNTGFKLEKPNKIYVNVCVDTVEISNKQIRYIKIDGIVYEIKRSTTLEKVNPMPTDTSWYMPRIGIQFLPNFGHIDTKSN